MATSPLGFRPVPPGTPLAEHLRRHRRAAGLTQSELAERAGLSVYSISNMERGVPHLPRPGTLRLLAAALALSSAEEQAFFEAAHAAEAPPERAACRSDPLSSRVSLPVLLTPLLGREGELTRLRALLTEPATPLVMLTGPAGVGKTTLALAAAHLVRSAFADGVAFIALSTCTDSTRAWYALAHSLEVEEQSGSRLPQQVVRALSPRRQLLLLDNCEQVQGIAELVLYLLQSCPHLRLLVTSRVRLHVPGEQPLVLEPLAVPDLAALPPLADLQRVPAFALLVQRIQAYQPTFVVTAANAATVAVLCVRLEGVPLALELAAARCRLFSPAEMLARLHGSFAALAHGPQILPERQRSLQAALQWSHALLERSEHVLFRRLAVFADGATLAAIEGICAQPPLQKCALDILVEQLLDHSLVQRRERSGTTRITQFETVRAFAQGFLAASEEEPLVRRAHAHYFLSLAEAVAAELRGPDQREWQLRLRDEYTNVITGLDWSLSQQDVELSLRFVNALWRYWYRHNMLTEGNAWVRRALSLEIPRTHRHLQADALNGAGWLAFGQADYPRARTLHTASLELSRELGDEAGIARALNNLGGIARLTGDYREAQQLFEESRACYQRINEKPGLSAALSNLAAVAWSLGEYGRARTLAQASLALDKELGDRSGMALTMEGLGELAIDRDDLAEAQLWLNKALEMAREVDDRREVVSVLRSLGDVRRMQGDLDQAEANYSAAGELLHNSTDRTAIAGLWQRRGELALARDHLHEALEWYTQSVQLHVELGSQREIAQCLEGLARVGAQSSEEQRALSAPQAVTFLAAASRLRQSANAHASKREEAQLSAAQERLRRAVGEHKFTAAWQEGQTAALASLMASLAGNEPRQL
jgi:predicted ATPase/transcriptional regulator with XRE-family HTH domain